MTTDAEQLRRDAQRLVKARDAATDERTVAKLANRLRNLADLRRLREQSARREVEARHASTAEKRARLAKQLGGDVAKLLDPDRPAECLGLRLGRGGPSPHLYLVFQTGTLGERAAASARMFKLAGDLGLEPGGAHFPDRISVERASMLPGRVGRASLLVDPDDAALRKLAKQTPR